MKMRRCGEVYAEYINIIISLHFAVSTVLKYMSSAAVYEPNYCLARRDVKNLYSFTVSKNGLSIHGGCIYPVCNTSFPRGMLSSK
jgi:hypothetical protein